MAPRITKDRMTGVLGPALKPKFVWQRQFDGNDDVLRALANSDRDAVMRRAQDPCGELEKAWT